MNEKQQSAAPDQEVRDGMVFEGTERSRKPGERFVVGQDAEHAAPLVRRWLAIGTVRPIVETR